MIEYFGAHYVELAAATAGAFIVVLGFVSIADGFGRRR